MGKRPIRQQQDCKPPLQESGSTQKDSSLLEVSGLSAWYGRRQVLDSLSFSLNPGDFICLSGPNGCGKSTLMSVLAGLGCHNLTATGTIILQGQPLHQLKSKERARQVSSMSQSETSLWNFTVEEVILTGRYCHTGFTGIYSKADKIIAQEAACQLQLEHLLHRPCHSLSGGEFQRVRIARSFCQQPALLLLDEPAAGMNPSETMELMENIVKIRDTFQIAIMLIEHDMNLVMGICEGICVLNFGQIIAKGTAEEIQSNPVVIEAYLGKQKEG